MSIPSEKTRSRALALMMVVGTKASTELYRETEKTMLRVQRENPHLDEQEMFSTANIEIPLRAYLMGLRDGAGIPAEDADALLLRVAKLLATDPPS